MIPNSRDQGRKRGPGAGALALVLAVSISLLAGDVAARAQTSSPGFGTKSGLSHAFVGQVFALKPGTDRLPDFSTLKPLGTIYTRELNIPARDWRQGFPGVTDRFEWFAIQYRATFTIARAGSYSFSLTSDDGSKLFIDGKKVIDLDGIHAPANASGSIDLTRSSHTMVLQYFQGPRYQIALQLSCASPGGQPGSLSACGIMLTSGSSNTFPWIWVVIAVVVFALLLIVLIARRRRALLPIAAGRRDREETTEPSSPSG